MRITQGTFSFLPDLTDEQISGQVGYALDNNWAIMIEHTDDPHPRNCYWDMWDQPMFDLDTSETDQVLEEVNGARKAYPQRYVKVVCYDRSLGRQSSGLSFIVNRPDDEPGFRLERQQKADRVVRYSLHAYATQDPPGRRYGDTDSEGEGGGDSTAQQSNGAVGDEAGSDGTGSEVA